jgi:type III secretory pathway component EscS
MSDREWLPELIRSICLVVGPVIVAIAFANFDVTEPEGMVFLGVLVILALGSFVFGVRLRRASSQAGHSVQFWKESALEEIARATSYLFLLYILLYILFEARDLKDWGIDRSLVLRFGAGALVSSLVLSLVVRWRSDKTTPTIHPSTPITIVYGSHAFVAVIAGLVVSRIEGVTNLQGLLIGVSSAVLIAVCFSIALTVPPTFGDDLISSGIPEGRAFRRMWRRVRETKRRRILKLCSSGVVADNKEDAVLVAGLARHQLRYAILRVVGIAALIGLFISLPPERDAHPFLIDFTICFVVALIVGGLMTRREKSKLRRADELNTKLALGDQRVVSTER